MDSAELDAYLTDCRQLTLHEIREIIPKSSRCHAVLYGLVLDYPLREAKALRPALCIATCRALGGSLEAVLRSAAILELYHNAFLIHDDVEDGSENRRGRPTLHWSHGMPIAVNVGDAMLALALEPLLDNMRLLGLGKALRILQVVARMARESTEGQAIELDWIRSHQWQLADSDYLRMVFKKTSWYTFIAPTVIGGIVAGATPEHSAALRRFAGLLGVAFQIQDDVLNLTGEGEVYGKEIAGDLWEGKHTLILMHALRTASDTERKRAWRILGKRRPLPAPGTAQQLAAVLDDLQARAQLRPAARRVIEDAVARAGNGAGVKTQKEIDYLLNLIKRRGSVDYARSVARRFALKASKALAKAEWLTPSLHRDFLRGLVDFAVSREW
ncbi:MAG: polyprenyl synthetase family protein [Deltaproteobacteria bacterium]|nr:polyprenyl synthetase family protein [Deltaproteobacteria bacterium]